MEGPCSDQSEPVLQGEPLHGPVGSHHQPARAMNFEHEKPEERTYICSVSVVWTLMDTLPPRDQIPKHCWWGKKKTKTLASTWDVFKRRKKSRGMDSLCGLFWSCFCQPWRRDGGSTCVVMRWTFQKARTLPVLEDPIMSVWWSLWSESERGGSVEWTRPLCRNKALVETLDLFMQFHLFHSNSKCWRCYCPISKKKRIKKGKGRAPHPVKTVCTSYASCFIGTSQNNYFVTI